MTPKKILVIEDEDGLREITQFSLEAAAGWDVLAAPSGSEGLVIAEAEQPDAILLDVMMPDMDGTETFRQLRANPSTQNIPAIFLTAKARGSEQQALMGLGISGVITKPVKPQELVKQIREILHWEE
jgi:CheY-like chemotaxis protein